MKKIFHAGVFIISTVVVGMFINLFFGIGVGIVYAETEIISSIDADTTWNLEGSPYVVKSGIAIYEGATLTIQPGVEVKFDNGSMAVFGSLHSDGTAEQTVSFSSALPDQDWSIFFRNSTSSLSHTVISGSSQPVFGMDTNLKIDHLTATNLTGPITFSNSAVDILASDFNHDGKILELYNNSNVTVSDSVFQDITPNDYDSAIVVYDSATLALQNVSIERITGGNALAVYTKGIASISSSTIAYGSGSGILTYKDAIVSLKNSAISDFAQDGIMAYLGAQVSLDRSSLIGNDKGLEIYTPINFHAEASDIYDNKTSGIDNTSGSNIDAKNVWWGNATGPRKETDNPSGAGNSVSSGVSFDPWLAEDPLVAPTPKCCSNVAFIPGLEGSRLYIPATLFGENQLWEPNRNADVEKLYMDENGQSIRTDVYTKDIIDESKIGGLNIYKTFEESMDDLVSNKVIQKWEALPYDWRKSPSDLVVGGTVVKNDQGDFDVLNFATEIEHLAASSTTGKVTLIAHSNGGLIAKLLVQELEKRNESNLVDKVVLVAVPELGTPKSIPALLNGYGQSFADGWILNDSVARSLGQNMQSAYNLLPSKEYFNQVTDPVVVFDPSVTATSSPFAWIGKNGNSLNTFGALQSFLLGQKDNRQNPNADDTFTPIVLNSKLLSAADTTHTALDSWQFPDNINVSQIVGWGLDTLSGIKYTLGKNCDVNGSVCPIIIDAKPIFTSDGDNTVVTASAAALNAKTYYVNLPKHNDQLLGLRRNRGHADILEISELQQLLENIISGTSTLPDLITTNAPDVSVGQSPSLHISVHSPVSIDAYDNAGNHTGLIPNPDPNSDVQMVEENIPNSFYLEFGEGKYVGVPVSASTTVKLQGTGYGTFTLNVDSSIGGIATTTAFTDIPVTPLTVAHIDKLTSSTAQLKLDVDGDGRDDFVVKPSPVFDPILYLQSMEQIVRSFNLKKAVEKDLLTRMDKVLNLIKNGKITKAETKIQKLIFHTEKKKAKKNDEADKNQFVDMINQLLNNIK